MLLAEWPCEIGDWQRSFLCGRLGLSGNPWFNSFQEKAALVARLLAAKEQSGKTFDEPLISIGWQWDAIANLLRSPGSRKTTYMVSTELMDCAVDWTNTRECASLSECLSNMEWKWRTMYLCTCFTSLAWMMKSCLSVSFHVSSAFHFAVFLPILSWCFSNTQRVVVLMRFTGFIVNEIAKTSQVSASEIINLHGMGVIQYQNAVHCDTVWYYVLFLSRQLRIAQGLGLTNAYTAPLLHILSLYLYVEGEETDRKLFRVFIYGDLKNATRECHGVAHSIST